MSFVVAGVVIGAAGVGLGVYSAIKSGQAANDQAQAASSLGMQNSRTNDQMGARKVTSQQRDAARAIGDAKANYSASGIDIGEGSALDVIQSSMEQAALDTSQIQYETSSRSQAFQMGAQNDAMAGQSAQTGGYLSAAGTLLTGASSVYAGGVKSGAFKGKGP